MQYAKHERKIILGVTKMRIGEQGRPSATDAAKPAPPAADAAPTAAAAAPKTAAPPLPKPVEKMSPNELNKLFPQIQVTAEQYPALRASENFQQFSKALIDVEKEITKQIMTYNERVNAFTTVTQQFPGNIFARVCGFKTYKFYVPERGDIAYRPVDYRDDG